MNPRKCFLIVASVAAVPGLLLAQDPGPAAKAEAKSALSGTTTGDAADKVLRAVNPFTGNAAAYEEAARELALARQKRNIAEQRLAEQRALTELEKVKREGAAPVFAAPQAIAAPALAQPVNQLKQPDERPAGVSGKRVTKRSQRRGDDPALSAGAGRASTVAGTPTLIGVTEIGGRRYALFEQSGKSLTIEEGGYQSGLSVGKIDGRDVVVNGVKRTVDVGMQEVAFNPRRPAGALTQSSAATQDMATLNLPTIADPPNLTGPQPLPSGIAGDGGRAYR